MKTVLHLLNTSTYSGAENVAITIIRNMSRLYPDYKFVYVSPDGPIRERLDAEGIDFEPIAKISRKEVRRVVKKYRPALIHAHDFTASIVSAYSTLRVPVISHIHNNTPWLGRIGVKTVAYGLSTLRYKKILGVSPSVFDEFIFGGLVKKKSEVIGNPVDLKRIQEAAKQAEIKDGYDLVFLGRLTEPKNPILFVDTVAELSKRMKLSTVMIGEGGLRCAVEERIAALGLGDTVKLLGFIDNPHGVLASSKVLVMTSSWEGYGLVAAEALALGKPVVATAVGGIPTIIKGGEGSFASDVDSFATAIETLLTDGEKYAEASGLAMARANEIDNIGEYAEKINRIYSGE